MTGALKVGTSEIEVRLKRNKRAKRLTLRVSAIDGKPVLTLPYHATVTAAQKFLDTQQTWLQNQLAQAAPLVLVGPGAVIPFQGEKLVVTPHGKTGTKLAPGHILTPGHKHTGQSVARFLIRRARIASTGHCNYYADKLGRQFGKISLRDPRSRWGSCSSEGNLMFSWRLVMAPAKVLEYVVAHEIAHLHEMNHSPAFWQTVADLMPEYERHQNWLKLNGAILHRLDFKAGLT